MNSSLITAEMNEALRILLKAHLAHKNKTTHRYYDKKIGKRNYKILLLRSKFKLTRKEISKKILLTPRRIIQIEKDFYRFISEINMGESIIKNQIFHRKMLNLIHHLNFERLHE